MSVASGAAVGVAAPYAISNFSFLQSNWWTMPLAMAMVGHFLQRKNAAVGGALMGVAGYWGYTGFQNSRGAATASAKGFVDAVALLNYNDNIGTDAAPRMGTAQAAMLIDPRGRSPMAAGLDQPNFIDAGDTGDAGAMFDAYGLEGG
jgi:hypothetical protein